MSDAMTTCSVDPQSMVLMDRIAMDRQVPGEPSELRAISESGELVGMMLSANSFSSYNPINKHLVLRVDIDGEPDVPVVVDMLDPEGYQVSYFENLAALRQRVIFYSPAAA